MRNWMRGILAGVGCLALAGCSPPRMSITAVYLQSGRPIAVVQPCPGTRVSSLHVVEQIAESTASAPSTLGGSWSISARGTDRRTAEAFEAPLLQLPAGWEIQTLPEYRLASFAEGRRYHVNVTAVGADHNDVGVDFTLADLRTLRDGELWAAERPHESPRAVSRDDFRNITGKYC